VRATGIHGVASTAGRLRDEDDGLSVMKSAAHEQDISQIKIDSLFAYAQ
jgi:hypothetical protein